MDWKDALSALAEDMPDNSAAEPETSEPAATEAALNPQTLTLFYEKKGRKGKAVTIIAGFDDTWTDEDVAALLSMLQSGLGVGGSSRGGEILLQGDCRTRAAAHLRTLGHKVKGI